MKYLKYFEEVSAHETYKNGSGYVLPNVSYIEENKGVSFDPYVEPPFEIEIPSPYTEWARIQHKDGTLYTADEWLAAESAGTVTDADANGVAVLYSKYAVCPHVIHPKYSADDMRWCSSYSINVPGVLVTEDKNTALLDVKGKANTEAILAAVADGIIPDAPVAQYCVEVTFADGQKGYLPAAGEHQAQFDNMTAVNACIDAIGGDQVDTKNSATSTLYSTLDAWYWQGGSNSIGYLNHTIMYGKIYARPMSAFEYNPKNEFSNK